MTDQLTPMPSDTPWWAKWLRENWRVIWKDASSWFFWLIGLLGAAAELTPAWVPQAKQFLSGPMLHYTIAACAVAGFISKYVKQNH